MWMQEGINYYHSKFKVNVFKVKMLLTFRDLVTFVL